MNGFEHNLGMTSLNQERVAYDAHRDGFELELQSCFYQIWLCLYQNMADPDAPHAPENAKITSLKRMMEYIGHHLQQKIALADIASAGGICPSSCSQLFRKYLNQTPIEYLTECRLELGATMLRETDSSITDIAYRVGFAGASYFTERFRQQYGCTPKMFRKRVNAGSL